MKIIITGGHLTPALAVIEELQKESGIPTSPGEAGLRGASRNQESGILFIGRKYPLEGESMVAVEYKIITQMGIPFVSLTTGRLQRKFTWYTIPSLVKIPIGFFQSLWWVVKFKPDIILSFGGYVALPVVIAGWLSKVPAVTHEQTVVSGLANRIIGHFAAKICVSWSDSRKYFPKEKVVLTGNPVRKEIFKIVPSSKFQVPSDKPVIYITGGSLGSHVINQAVSGCLTNLLEKYTVIHQCGDSQKFHDLEDLQIQRATLPRALRERYFLTKYVGPSDIGYVFKNTDLVVSRAGANTVTELAALGKPAILIPIPWSERDEQMKNAQILAKFGGAVILEQGKLSSQILEQQIDQMMENMVEYEKKAKTAQKIIRKTAAAEIVEVINEIYQAQRST